MKEYEEQASIHSFVSNTLADNFLKLARVNLLTGEYEFIKKEEDLEYTGGDLPDIFSYIKQQVADKIVMSEHIEDYLKFSNPNYVQKRIFSGEKHIVQSYKRKTKTGYMWVTFEILAPTDCSMENPWVVFSWRAADSDTTTMLDSLAALSLIYYKILKINLTHDTFEIIKAADSERRLYDGLTKISDWWRLFCEDGNVDENDIEAYTEFTDLNRLRDAFGKNPTRHSCRYNRKNGDVFRYAQMDLIPSIEYTEENKVVLLFVKDVHDEHLLEEQRRRQLLDTYHRDSLTMLYNRHKFNEDVEQLQKENAEMFTCAYIDVNGLHELNNHLGHRKGDDMLCTVADALITYFPNERRYRIGGDEFVVTSTSLSTEAMTRIILQMREKLLEDDYEFSFGVESGGGNMLFKVVGAAELKMRKDKEEYYKHNHSRRKNRAMNNQLEQIMTEKRDAEHFLDIIATKFAGVYLVDLKRDEVRHIYIPHYFQKLLQETDFCFSKAMNLYVSKFVDSEYRSAFDRVIDYGELEKLLDEKSEVAFPYKKVDGSWKRLRIMRIDETDNPDDREAIWIFSNGAQEM